MPVLIRSCHSSPAVLLNVYATTVRQGQQILLPFLVPAVAGGARCYSRSSGGPKEAPSKEWVDDARNTIRSVHATIVKDTQLTRVAEPDAPPPQAIASIPFDKPQHFSDEEVAIAQAYIEKIRKTWDREDTAYAALTKKKKRSNNLRTVIPDARDKLRRMIETLETELDMLMHEQKNLRQQRYTVRYLLDKGRTVDAVAKQIMALPSTARAKYFSVAVPYLIHYKQLHRVAAVVLEAFTRSPNFPHSDRIGKAYYTLCYERLQKFSLLDGNSNRKRQRENVARECVDLLLRIISLRKDMQIPQHALHLVINNSPPSILSDLHWKLLHGGVRMTQFTQFHFIRQLAKPDYEGISHWREAMKILQTLHYRQTKLMENPARGGFYSVLAQAMLAKDAKATEELLQMMTSIGLKPGVEVYNMLMARASAEGDEEALRRYFNAIKEAGYKPNMVSQAISHAFYKRLHNERMRQSVVREAVELDRRLNLHLATDILHSSVLQEKSYVYVFRQYRSMFRTELLEKFGMSLHNDKHSRDMNKFTPDHVTLAVMMSAYCNDRKKLEEYWRLYKTYQELLHLRSATNRKTRNILLKVGSYIPHAIMLGLGRKIQGLPYVAAVLEDMLKPGAPVESDVYTWSIFLNFLTRAGKMEEAEKVINVMKQRGLEPNVVTMSTLLNGYVRAGMQEEAEDVLGRMQDGPEDINPGIHAWTSLLHGYVKAGENWKAGDTFKRMLDSSTTPDEVTLQAVSSIGDREIFEKGLAGEVVDLPDSDKVVEKTDDTQQEWDEDDGWFDDEGGEWDDRR
ncbi:hypothetical protein BZA77DRAFT_320164 [Pyronema omphalodes]|nr:hypothetical protein BZA77DRAFT_320164 [Pyronema omphalodes]